MRVTLGVQQSARALCAKRVPQRGSRTLPHFLEISLRRAAVRHVQLELRRAAVRQCAMCSSSSAVRQCVICNKRANTTRGSASFAISVPIPGVGLPSSGMRSDGHPGIAIFAEEKQWKSQVIISFYKYRPTHTHRACAYGLWAIWGYVYGATYIGGGLCTLIPGSAISIAFLR